MCLGWPCNKNNMSVWFCGAVKQQTENERHHRGVPFDPCFENKVWQVTTSWQSFKCLQVYSIYTAQGKTQETLSARVRIFWQATKRKLYLPTWCYLKAFTTLPHIKSLKYIFLYFNILGLKPIKSKSKSNLGKKILEMAFKSCNVKLQHDKTTTLGC